MNNKAIEYFENRLCELNGLAQFEDDADIASNIECEICFIELAISAIKKVDKLEKIIAQYNPLYEEDFLAMVNLVAKSVLALEIDLKTGKKED